MPPRTRLQKIGGVLSAPGNRRGGTTPVDAFWQTVPMQEGDEPGTGSTTKPSLGCQLLAVATLLAVAGCLFGGVRLLIRHFDAQPASAKLNECLADDVGGDPPYRHVSCDDKAARYRVLQIAGWSVSGPNPCVEVPGSTLSFEHYGDDANSTFCLGDKDVDPAMSVNTARTGDCLVVGRDQDALRVDCGDPRANFTVLQRQRDVWISDMPTLPGSISDAPCSAVPGTVTTYGLQWHTVGPPVAMAPLPGRHFDLMFCLQRVHEPPPAVATGPANCRYLTPAALLGAANAVSGNHYRSVRINATKGSAPCIYILQAENVANDLVTIEMIGDLQWPPQDHTEFTIDGVKAAWRAGGSDGIGSLSVARSTGRLEIRLVLGGGRPNLRDIAESIYRAAAAYLP